MKGIAAEITKNPTILMKALREELKKNKNPPAIAGLNLFESHDKNVKVFNTQSKEHKSAAILSVPQNTNSYLWASVKTKLEAFEKTLKALELEKQKLQSQKSKRTWSEFISTLKPRLSIWRQRVKNQIAKGRIIINRRS